MALLKDITGSRYGNLVVLKLVGKAKNGQSKWECLCDCGSLIVCSKGHLTTGDTTNCGCKHEQDLCEIIGSQFGRLLIIKFYGRDFHRHLLYECLCECGNTVVVAKTKIVSGKVKSCGCFVVKKEKTKRNQRIYKIWIGMKKRCNNSNSSNYHNYGGRGIKLCDQWENDFTSFYNWAINHGYDDSLSIERMDNNGWYAPDNCKWATRIEQNRNSRRNRHIEINGETKLLTEWAKQYDIPISTIYCRINRGLTGSDLIKKKNTEVIQNEKTTTTK